VSVAAPVQSTAIESPVTGALSAYTVGAGGTQAREQSSAVTTGQVYGSTLAAGGQSIATGYGSANWIAQPGGTVVETRGLNEVVNIGLQMGDLQELIDQLFGFARKEVEAAQAESSKQLDTISKALASSVDTTATTALAKVETATGSGIPVLNALKPYALPLAGLVAAVAAMWIWRK